MSALTRKFHLAARIGAVAVTAATIALAGTASGAGALTGPHCAFSIGTEQPHATPKCATPPKQSAAESLSSSLNPIVAGQAVTFTVTVQSATPGGGQPTGNVLFASIDPVTENITGITTVALTNGIATWTTSTLAVGVDGLEAQYSGSFTYNGNWATYYEQVNPLVPAITSIAPKKGPVGGGTRVTVKGVNFAGVTGISVGGVAATGVACKTTTKCTFTTPAGAKGKADVEVTTGSGTTAPVSADVFKYVVVAP